MKSYLTFLNLSHYLANSDVSVAQHLAWGIAGERLPRGGRGHKSRTATRTATDEGGVERRWRSAGCWPGGADGFRFANRGAVMGRVSPNGPGGLWHPCACACLGIRR